MARVLLELHRSGTRTKNPRELQHVWSGYYVRSTPKPGLTGRLCPIQAPPAGMSLARGLRLLSPLLKRAVLSEMCVYHLDTKPFPRISKENMFPPPSNSSLEENVDSS